MRKYIKIFTITLITLLIFCTSLSVAADFGDISGSSDYGGSDYGGSSSYGGSYDSDYNGGVYIGGFFGSEAASIIVAVIVMIIILYTQYRKKAKNGNVTPSNRPAGATPTIGLSPLDTIYSWDSNFSADEIKQRLSKLYVQMQNCWTAKDLTQLRGDFTDEQFAQYDRQLDNYRRDAQTNMIERIAVLEVSLKGVKQDENHDILIAELMTRITDYTVDDNTGNVVRGNKNAEKFMRYEWTLIRPKGSQTMTQNSGAFNCPNCGAAMEINKSAKCPYCSSMVSKAEYDWVIAGIKGLSQQTI